MKKSTVVDRAYRTILFMFPAEFRREFGDDMAQMFRDRCREARREPLGLVRTWLQAFVDALAHGTRERKRALEAAWCKARENLSYRRKKRGPSMNSLSQDIRYAFRTLWKSPVFSIVAVLTLALGIGANTAVFSVLENVILSPLPYDEPEQLVRIVQLYTPTGEESQPVSAPVFLDYRENLDRLESVAALNNTREWGPTLTGRGSPQRVTALPVSFDFFRVYRVPPLLGRTLHRADEQGPSQVVVLSHRFWMSFCDGDAGIMGQNLILDGEPYEVVGVMPACFIDVVGGDVDIWLPHDFETRRYDSPLISSVSNSRGNHYLSVIGRMKSGVTIDQAQAQLDARSAHQKETDPATYEKWSARMTPLHDDVVGRAATMLRILMGAAGLVLLIACVNVASLFMGRCLARQRELAIRAALGSGRYRLARQLLTESLVLAIAGGLAGLALAHWGVEVLLALSPDSIPRAHEISPDRALFVFALIVTVTTGLLFGLAPAFGFASPKLERSLATSDRANTSGLGASRMRAGLVTCQITLALLLLVGSGLLMKSFLKLQHVDLGLTPENTLTLKVHLPDSMYGDPADRAAFHQTFADRVKAIPGVERVGAISYLPVTGVFNAWIFGVTDANGELKRGLAQFRIVEGEFFETLDIPLVAGRTFERSDHAETAPVAMINVAAAEKYFPGRNPLGQEILMSDSKRRIVGIVQNVAHDPRGTTSPKVYIPHAQFADDRNWSLTQLIATVAERPDLVDLVRAELAAVDSGLVVHNVRSMASIADQAIAREEFAFTLMSVFAGVALLLAAVGIYGVLSYSVGQRTREIGIRMALGAHSRHVWRSVLRQGSVMVALGIVGGLLGAFLFTRLMRTLLYEVSVTDPLVFCVAPIALILVAGIAGYVPARRATRVDPLDAIRCE
jgi:predicted permease